MLADGRWAEIRYTLPTMKPKPIFLTAEWRYLLMINYEIDPVVLAPLVPAGTELDFWNGRCYVSLVGFLFLDTRVLGVPIPFHRHFEEVNLRFYVRHRAEDGWRRGVVFVKELVPKWAIAAVARWVYNENYAATRMTHRLELESSGVVEYGWQWQQRPFRLTATVTGEPQPALPGSEAEFITEHYWGYARQRNGGTTAYQVEHPSWGVWSVAEFETTGDMGLLYGAAYAPALAQTPTSVFVADGSAVVVRQGDRLATPPA